MSQINSTFFTFLLIIIGLLMSVVSVESEMLKSYPVLEKQVKLKQYQQAYQQAVKLRSQNEGEPRFDYLYGLSALQTGHYNEAVFALDRVTVTTPNVIRPRLELARAYLKLNNRTAAIKEFNDVLKLTPPPIVRQKVNTYMAELKKGGRKVQKSVTKRLASFSIGYDDNINFGYENSEIDLPGFGSVKLNPSAIKQKSGFAETRFKLKHQINNDKKRNTFFAVNLAHRRYFKSSDFNYTDLDLRAGVTLNHKKNQYQLVLRDRPIFLDGNLYSNTIGIDAIARKSLGKGQVLSASLTLEDYNIKQLSSGDRQRALIGARLDKYIGEIQHQFNLYLGKEFPSDDAGKQFSRDIVGVGYRATHKWNAKNKSFLNLDYRKYNHQAAYPVFPDKRSDDRFIIKAVHELQINDKATLLFSAKHVDNDSNLELYRAERSEVQVGIRYEWD